MASPFLANLALGYVKQQQANQKAVLERQYAEESEQRKLNLEVEKQKRLDQLSFESLMQKTVVQKGMNQQNNARIAEQYNQIALTTKDPVARKQAQKWASVYAGAGDLPGETVETLGKNLSPEKAGEVSVQELEFKRKQSNEQLFEDKLTELGQLDMSQLESDPKLKQRTFLSLTKGLDTDYVEKLREHFDAFFPKPVTQRMPEHLKNADIQYRTLYSKYMSQRSAVVQGKAEPSDLEAIEGQINQLAESLNDWAKENGLPQQYVLFEDDDQDPETPGIAITPQQREQREAAGKAFGEAQKGYFPGGDQSTAQTTTRVDLPTRIQQIKAQNPDLTPAAIAKQLIQEGYSP